jgi:hypothetical protein
MKIIKNLEKVNWVSLSITFIVISIICGIIVFALLILALVYLFKWIYGMGTGLGIGINESDISKLTDLWIKEVTVNNDPEAVAKLFCSDGTLVGTVSQVKRRGTDIRRYFDYFAKLPGIKVVSKKYNISKVSSNVYINTAFIRWKWNGLYDPIMTRMTFIYSGKCIFQLHSSKLPEVNDQLFQISNMV